MISDPPYPSLIKMRKFTKKELAKCSGKKGARIYVAYKGKVYDVSQSFLWQNGRHQVVHTAGKDLTQALVEAPHGLELLEKFRIVGTLEDS
jgi:predicted heme/steroid binding protein